MMTLRALGTSVLFVAIAACAPQSHYAAPAAPSQPSSSEEEATAQDDDDGDGAGAASSGWYCFEEKSSTGGTSDCERDEDDCSGLAEQMKDAGDDDATTTVSPCTAAEIAYCFDYTPVGRTQIDSCGTTSADCDASHRFTIKTKDDPEHGVEPGSEISDCEERR
jgi:hypothetical protein